MIRNSAASSSRANGGQGITEDAVFVRADGKLDTVSVVIVNKNERALSDTLDALKSSLGQILDEVLVVDASSGALDDIRDVSRMGTLD